LEYNTLYILPLIKVLPFFKSLESFILSLNTTIIPKGVFGPKKIRWKEKKLRKLISFLCLEWGKKEGKKNMKDNLMENLEI